MTAGVGLLEAAVRYSCHAAHLVSPTDLARATPCAAWNLSMLLAHMCESAAALHEAFTCGHVDHPATVQHGMPVRDPITAFREHADRLLSVCAQAGGASRDLISVADSALPTTVLIAVGAIEFAVHGWDLSHATGHGSPIPGNLAAQLLTIASTIVPSTGRDALFAAPVDIAQTASRGDQLVAYFGRSPAEWERRTR